MGIEILRFEDVLLGKFLERSNRFLARVLIGEKEFLAHVHDPGRVKDLLFYGNEVALIPRRGKRRRTRYDLIGAKRGREWTFIHSGYHSKIAEKLISSGGIKSLRGYSIRRKEINFGKSRIDFELTPRALLEVKGCTLIKNGIALFPDAPTERGRRHVNELEKALREGYEAILLFLVFGSAKEFSPNWETDPRFSSELLRAVRMGIKVIAYSLRFDSRSLRSHGEIPLNIRKG